MRIAKLLTETDSINYTVTFIRTRDDPKLGCVRRRIAYEKEVDENF